ncbi:MAG: histidine phosphatase family protein [Candidatus Vogelbacteria bacterium]|nr:histidine phosphatase family protein [Candidatus Vogelbacteria bacterium]
MESLKTFELKEKEPFRSDLTADFVRHGQPKYTEEELKSAKLEGQLTEEGIKQTERRAIELVGKIDKEKELIVFWVSPRQRAQQTAGIISDIFQRQGIQVLKNLHTSPSLSDIKTSPQFWDDVIKNSEVKKWMEYWSESDLPGDTEKPEEVKRRVQRVVTYLERIARTIKPPEGKKLRFICVGHEEIFRDLLEEGYGFGTKGSSGPSYAEVLSMDINKSEEKKAASLRLKFHGQEARLKFDKDNRNFSREEA